MPASARPLADEHGLTSRLHYSKAHLRKILDMKKAGRRVKLPAGIESVEQLEAIVNGSADVPEDSTDASNAGSLSGDSGTPTGTAGQSVGTGE